jgi:ribosomal protein S16
LVGGRNEDNHYNTTHTINPSYQRDGRFLDRLGFIRKGFKTSGAVGDIENYAKYITENAPISDDWHEMMKSAYKANTNDTEEIVRFEYLEDVLYQAYVMRDGVEVPMVVVNARTGWYHR